MDAEVSMRNSESRDWGWRENIVYTSEGFRRNTFQRVKYAVYCTSKRANPHDSFQVNTFVLQL